jgi:hypothetical protein
MYLVIGFRGEGQGPAVAALVFAQPQLEITQCKLLLRAIPIAFSWRFFSLFFPRGEKLLTFRIRASVLLSLSSK